MMDVGESFLGRRFAKQCLHAAEFHAESDFEDLAAPF
jgi:hypothetical protein